MKNLHNLLKTEIVKRVILLRGDTLVMDRWNWVKKNLPYTFSPKRLIDVGCGNGALTINSALRGYSCLGLTWEKKDQIKSQKLVNFMNINNCDFQIQDVRTLDKRKDLMKKFEIVICTENIEHIINDKKLLRDIHNCLVPGGRLLLTTPSLDFIPITSSIEEGPFKQIENGGHVRKGYSEKMIRHLCKNSNLIVDKIDFCGGFLSQKITRIYRAIGELNTKLGWISILPLRPIPLIFDNWLTKLLKYPKYSICLEAHKKNEKENI